MRTPASCRHHVAYPLEIWRGTLVLRPAGDSVGFSATAMSTELARIRELAKSPDIRHLIVDLSNGNYFGSVVIGELNQLGQVVRDRGGRTALAGLSNDMHDVVRVMKLDNLWEIHDSLPAALRKIARVPIWQQSLWILKPLLAIAVLAGVVAIGIAIWPWEFYERKYLAELEQLTAEFEELKRRGVSDSEWEIFLTKSRKAIEPMVEHLERYANGDRPAARYLLYASRDFCMATFMARAGEPSRMEVPYYHMLKLTREHLGIPQPPSPAEGRAAPKARAPKTPEPETPASKEPAPADPAAEPPTGTGTAVVLPLSFPGTSRPGNPGIPVKATAS